MYTLVKLLYPYSHGCKDCLVMPLIAMLGNRIPNYNARVEGLGNAYCSCYGRAGCMFVCIKGAVGYKPAYEYIVSIL